MSFKAAAESLMERVVKKFELKDLIKHKTVRYRNLYEICSQYPSAGVGFRVWRKTWPKGSFYTIKETSFKDFSHGKALGILTWKGQVVDSRPKVIRNGNKRGVWRYAIMNSSAKLDNGLFYSSEDMNAYRNKKALEESNEYMRISSTIKSQ